MLIGVEIFAFMPCASLPLILTGKETILLLSLGKVSLIAAASSRKALDHPAAIRGSVGKLREGDHLLTPAQEIAFTKKRDDRPLA